MLSSLQRLFGYNTDNVTEQTKENITKNENQKEMLDRLLHDGEYSNQQYPITNYGPGTGYKEIPYLEPRFFALQQHSHKIFAQRIADERWRYDQHWKVMGILTGITAIMTAQKNKYALAMSVPLCTVLFSWAYHYDLAHGNMINRVNQECQHIAVEEGKKKYFLSDEQVAQNAEQTTKRK
jgi:hypothetical protein